MKQGVLELVFLGISFLLLQVWWLSMTIKNGKRTQSEIDTKQYRLAAKKRLLENLFKK